MNMSKESRAPTRHLVEVGDIHHSGESACEGKKICDHNYPIVD